MTSLYPLRFEPLYKHYLWGGRRFETLLGRELEPGRVYAESWEIADHGEDQSIVRFGPLAGTSLHQLMVEHRDELLGRPRPTSADHPLADRFPLLLKFLDAAANLSLQVHPDNEMAARLDPPDLGKTEAWFVLAAEPGSRIYAGLKPGVDRATLARAIEEGTCAERVHWFEPTPGDCLFLPAGTVHGLGAGIMLAEIQQASDTTFRLFDWNRTGPDGRRRPLHIEQALAAIDFDAGPAQPVRIPVGDENTAVPVIDCDYFTLFRWSLRRPAFLGGDGRCHLVSVLDGSASIEGDPAGAPLSRGQTILLPAALPAVAVGAEPTATLLDVKVS